MFMRKKECVAMLLAGGQGSRLGVLTQKQAKPGVQFGGKYRIIDFTLSNCSNSGIDTVGVLTQYQPLELNSYIGNGQSWDLDRDNGGVHILPPYMKGTTGQWYAGTANAIYQNMTFIESACPQYVLILSGDHIYKMDYSEMIKFHKNQQADCTIAVIDVGLSEASQFGILNTYEDGRIYEFEEKPKQPKSTKASMGVYVFTWEKLKKYLIQDDGNKSSSHDFGKDIIPAMLSDHQKMMAYTFCGYWRDVGTIQSLWQANMDLLYDSQAIHLNDDTWRIRTKNPVQPPHYIDSTAIVKNTIIGAGANIRGEVYNSVIFPGVHIGTGAIVRDSIVMSGSTIGKNATINYSIVAQNTQIGQGTTVGAPKGLIDSQIAVIGEELHLSDNQLITSGIMLDQDI